MGLTECRRKSLPWLPPPSRSRSLLLPSASTPSGSVVPSWPLCPPSSPCGSPRRSTTSLAPASSTASASKHIIFLFNLDPIKLITTILLNKCTAYIHRYIHTYITQVPIDLMTIIFVYRFVEV